MIKSYTKGNLLDTPYIYIAHGCNCFHTMGAGVAKALKDKWPEVYKADLEDSEYADPTKLGKFTVASVIDVQQSSRPIGKIVFNCYTQYRFGRDKRHADYEAIRVAFKAINDILAEDNPVDLAIPKIGAGLAGGDWNVIEQIINKATPDINVHVYEL